MSMGRKQAQWFWLGTRGMVLDLIPLHQSRAITSPSLQMIYNFKIQVERYLLLTERIFLAPFSFARGLETYLTVKQATQYISNEPWGWYQSPSKLWKFSEARLEKELAFVLSYQCKCRFLRSWSILNLPLFHIIRNKSVTCFLFLLMLSRGAHLITISFTSVWSND